MYSYGIIKGERSVIFFHKLVYVGIEIIYIF